MLRGAAIALGVVLLALLPLTLRADDGGVVTATVVPNALGV